MNSIWIESAKRPHFEKLENDVKTDVLVIGGGITGILCAYMLKEAGVDYTLVEAKEICTGITKNTTAKITSQHGLIYDSITGRYGTEAARKYLLANERALAKYRLLCKGIDCDFCEKDNFVYSVDKAKKIEKELCALDKIGFCAKHCSELPIPIHISGAVGFERQAQFHPLKFAFSIAKSLNIYENTRVSYVTPKGAVTESGARIRAEKIIVATHFPFINKHGSYFLKMYQHRSYVLALENAPKTEGMYVDEADKGMSFREYNNLLLLGGGGHRTGKKGGGWQELSGFAKRNYTGAHRVCQWATQDCKSLDGIPYIGNYSARTPNLYVATGFNKWGMSSAMVSAMILSDMIRDKENPYASVFSPSRSMLHTQLAQNGAEAIINLVTPTAPRCPHMGCALKYNRQEHTWDCPCHGSRFTESGKLIDNPATDDKRI